MLTATGMEQAKTLRSKMAGIVDQIDVVISSPLSRALHTSELVFGDSIAKEKKIGTHSPTHSPSHSLTYSLTHSLSSPSFNGTSISFV